jgi:hypothetical protein
LVLTVPAIMKFQFMNAPKKAEMPTRMPSTSVTPMAISPMTMSFANQT